MKVITQDGEIIDGTPISPAEEAILDEFVKGASAIENKLPYISKSAKIALTFWFIQKLSALYAPAYDPQEYSLAQQENPDASDI